jgi:hypothetical protein
MLVMVFTATTAGLCGIRTGYTCETVDSDLTDTDAALAGFLTADERTQVESYKTFLLDKRAELGCRESAEGG